MELKIYTDRLKHEHKVSFQGKVSSFPLLTPEKDLIFADSIEISINAYLAGDHLMLELNATTSVQMPCSICNELVTQDLTLSHLAHAEPLEEIFGGVFDFSDLLRTSLLLELPSFVECQGKCPEREKLKKYLKPENPSSHSQSAQFPFSSL
jgi:uncharacterized metal-binding protein YceD (DUF177 family)